MMHRDELAEHLTELLGALEVVALVDVLEDGIRRVDREHRLRRGLAVRAEEPIHDVTG